PCVAADIAFDAALKTYPTKDVVLVRYHVHLPPPDPLANADTEARMAFYGADVIKGVPTCFVDGKSTESLGGGRPRGKASHDTLRAAAAEALEAAAQAKLTLGVKRAGENVSIKADVADVAKPGARVKLRLLLVEEVARYPGRNQQRLHHHVVRAVVG